MSRHLSSALLVIVVTGLTVQAADPIQLKVPKKPGEANSLDADPGLIQSEAAGKQEALRRQFDDFKQSLLRLAQRLEGSSKQEDRDKAAILKRAIALASEQGVDTKFTTLVAALKSSDTFSNLEQLQVIMDKNEDLRKDLRNLIELLLSDDRDAELRRRRDEYTRLLERLKEIIAIQERVRDQTGLNRKATKDLKKDQDKVTKQTRGLFAPQEKDAKGTGAKGDAKSGNKGNGEAKDDAKDPKGSDRSQDAKDAKAGGKGDGGKGVSKEKSGSEKGKPESGKPEEKAGGIKTAKSNEPKQADPKSDKSDAKNGAAKESKPSEGSKASDSKSKSEGKSEARGGSSGKPGEGNNNKPSESKGQQGQQSPQSQAKGNPQPGGGQPSPPRPPSDQQPQEQAQVKKKIQDANDDQKKAGEDLAKNNRPKAGENQDSAIQKFNEAKKRLEELLRQLREEEIERLLAALQARCERMLAMQIAVRDGTTALDKTIQGNSDKKPTRADEQQSNVFSDKEEDIVREAGKALNIIEAEGSAVAFAEVFKQVRGDMMTVAARLRKTDVGEVTVRIEEDIIATLKEMIEALKKARQDNQKPKQPPPGQSGPPPDPKLIDMLAELKMIRSMQKRVNDRTETYGRLYEGEQVPATNDMVQRELRDLGLRQDKIGRIVNDIYKGKNKTN